MVLTNQQIYTYANALSQTFGGENTLTLPIKINFFLQKNIKLLMDLAKDIEEARLNIASRFGVLNDEGTAYAIAPDKMQEANDELKDLFTLGQDVPLHIFKLEDFEGLEFTFAQMNALMFMIEE